jgi:MSHA pilin protein MshA
MKPRQSGFTLIELIVVIVILGILAATAVPKFLDLRGEAIQGAADGIAGAAASAINLNYSGCVLKNHAVTANVCAKVSACTDVAGLLKDPVPSGYTIGGTDPGTTNGGSSTCTVSRDGKSASFTATAAGN